MPPIPLDVTRLIGFLVRVVILLALLSTLGQLLRFVHGRDTAFGFVPAFYLDEEGNVPTFFATLLHLMAALSLLLSGAVERGRGGRFARHWTALGLIFLLLALDESASLHELASEPVQALLGGTHGVLRFAWVVPGMLFVLVVGLAYVPFLRALPRSTARGLVLAGVLFVGGAVGLELVEGAMLDAAGGPTLALSMAVEVEETLEMLGVVVLLATVLRHLQRTLRGVRVVFSDPSN